MKKLSLIVAVCFAAIVCNAQTTTTISNILNQTALNATTNYGTPVLIGYYNVFRPPTIDVYQPSGETTTNAAIYYPAVGFGTNPTNFTLISTNFFSTTNGGDLLIPQNTISIPIYETTWTITTNNVTNGIKAVFNR